MARVAADRRAGERVTLRRVRGALPPLRAAGRDGEGRTLAGAVEAHAWAGNGASYEVDVPALVGRLRWLGSVQLPAVIDLTERTPAARNRGR